MNTRLFPNDNSFFIRFNSLFFFICTFIRRAAREYPLYCHRSKSTVECIRGKPNAYKFIMLACFFCVCLAVLYVSITMSMVYKSVSDIEKKARRYSFPGLTNRSPVGDSPRRISLTNVHQRSRSRRVMIQGILYSAALLLINIFAVINVVMATMFGRSRGPSRARYALLLLQYIFWPLQGFINALIYSIPILQRMNNRRREKRRNRQEEKDTHNVKPSFNFNLDHNNKTSLGLNTPCTQQQSPFELEPREIKEENRETKIARKEVEETKEEIKKNNEIAAKALHLEIMRDQSRYNNMIDNINEHEHKCNDTKIGSGADVRVSVDSGGNEGEERVNRRLNFGAPYSEMIKQHQSEEDVESRFVDNKSLRDNANYRADIDDYLALSLT
jgi:hypothetical protein